MKYLKTILSNALVLATLVTALAGTVLVAYADGVGRPEGSVAQANLSADNGGRQSQAATPADQDEAPTTTGTSKRKAPPVILWDIEIPRGSYLDAML